MTQLNKMIDRQSHVKVEYYPEVDDGAGDRQSRQFPGECNEGEEIDWPPWQGFAEDVALDIEAGKEYESDAEWSDTQSAWEDANAPPAAPSTHFDPDTGGDGENGWNESPGWDGYWSEEEYPAESWKDQDWYEDM